MAAGFHFTRLENGITDRRLSAKCGSLREQRSGNKNLFGTAHNIHSVAVAVFNPQLNIPQPPSVVPFRCVVLVPGTGALCQCPCAAPVVLRAVCRSVTKWRVPGSNDAPHPSPRPSRPLSAAAPPLAGSLSGSRARSRSRRALSGPVVSLRVAGALAPRLPDGRVHCDRIQTSPS